MRPQPIINTLHHGRTTRILIACVSLLVVGGACGDGDPPPPSASNCSGDGCRFQDPWAFGDFPVGVRTDLWFDTSRTALQWEGRAGGPPCPRPVPVTIWYPAAEDTQSDGTLQIEDFLPDGAPPLDEIIAELVDLLGGDPPVLDFSDRTFAGVVDASLRAGRYPLIVFSHGAGGVRFQNLSQVEYLASHGYIVVAPDHEGDATLTFIEGELVTVNPELDSFVRSATKRPNDVKFVIDRMAELDNTPDHWLADAVETRAVGLTGHSFGAFTSITLGGLDPRITATVPMAAPGLSLFSEPVATLMMIATEDDTIDCELNAVMRAQADLDDAPVGVLELLDAGHFTFSNMCDIFPNFGDGCGTGERVAQRCDPDYQSDQARETFEYIDPDTAFRLMNGVGTAWFGAYVKEDSRYVDILRDNETNPPLADAARYELELVLPE